jgi:hypothetical protein
MQAQLNFAEFALSKGLQEKIRTKLWDCPTGMSCGIRHSGWMRINISVLLIFISLGAALRLRLLL